MTVAREKYVGVPLLPVTSDFKLFNDRGSGLVMLSQILIRLDALTSSPQCGLIPSPRRGHPSDAQVVSEVPRDGQELALVYQDRTAPLALPRYAVGFHGLGQLCLTEPSGFLARNSLRRFIAAANHESQIANMPILRWFQASKTRTERNNQRKVVGGVPFGTEVAVIASFDAICSGWPS
jgi:hypothetical protein